MNDFASWLRAHMENLGIGQNELARRTGLTSSAINYYLNGDARSGKPVRPGEGNLALIAKALKTPLDEARQAAGYAPLEKVEHSEETRILNFYRELPETVRRMINIQIEALWVNFSEGDIQQEELTAVPMIADSAVAREKPDKGDDSDGRTDGRDSHTWNSKRRKAG